MSDCHAKYIRAGKSVNLQAVVISFFSHFLSHLFMTMHVLPFKLVKYAAMGAWCVFMCPYALLLHHVISVFSSREALPFKSSGWIWISSIYMLSLLAQYFLNQLGGPASQDISTDK